MHKKVLLFLFLVFNVILLKAQTGVIKGKITDNYSNKAVAAVSISLQGTTIAGQSDSLGNFNITGLNPGVYNVVFSVIGYRNKTFFDVLVNNAKATLLDVSLEAMPNQLAEVTVQVKRYPKPLESPLSLRSIGATEIKRNPGGNRDISKVIQSLPGVSTPVSFRNDIIIRGGAPNENRFYIDGVEIPNINHFTTQGSSGGPVGLINVDFINQVDFYSGAFPASRGNSLSSVFEFKQREGNPDKLAATLTLGSSDFATTLDGPIGKKTTFLASYRLSYLQGLFKLLKLPFLPTYQDFQFKVKTKFNSANELTFLGLGAIDKFELNFDTKPTEQNLYTLSVVPVNKQDNYTVGAVYKNYRERGFSTLVISRNYLNTAADKFQDNDESKLKTLTYSSKETENKFRFENSSKEGNYKIDFGVLVETGAYEVENNVLLPTGPEVYNSSFNMLKYGAFFQTGSSYFNDRLNLSLGFRLDGNNYASQMNNPFKTFSPRFSASYNFTDQVSFNFNTGVYYQLPAYTVLGYREQTGAPLLNKNRVDYINATHLVAGVEYNPERNTKFTIEAFYKKYKNYPLIKDVNDTVPLANLGADFGVVGNRPVVGQTDGRSYGVEFFAQQRLTKGFYGIFSLTLFRSEFKDKNFQYVQSSWNNRYILSVTGGKIFAKNWEVGAKLRLSGGSPYTDYDIPYSSLKTSYSVLPSGVKDYDRLNADRLGSFYQVDVRVDKKYPFKRFNLNIFIDIQNLTNNKYQLQPSLVLDRDANGNPQDAPGDPSRFKTKLLNNNGGNILPSIGVIFDF